MIDSKNILSTCETAFAVDRNGQIVIWNQAAEQTFGYSESEALVKQCWELLSGLDIFGNPSCCEGCPIRAAAFNDEPINRFQIYFETASHKRKRVTVSALILFNGPGKKVFVHLCHPESELAGSTVIKHTANHLTLNEECKTLTPRETEVLTLLYKGMTVAKIAALLSVSSSTVRNHTHHILRKLEVHTRYEAVLLGRKLGLI